MVSDGLPRLLEFLAEQSFHLPPNRHGLGLLTEVHVCPAQALVLADVPLQHKAMGQSDRQTFNRKGMLRRHELAVSHEPTLAIELFAGLEIALRSRDDVTGKCLALTSGLSPTHDSGDRDAQLETDEVVGLELRGKATGLVGLEAVLGKTVSLVRARGYFPMREIR